MRQRSPRLWCVVVMPMMVVMVVVGMAMLLGMHGARELNRARTRNLAMQLPAIRPSDKLQGMVNNTSPK